MAVGLPVVCLDNVRGQKKAVGIDRVTQWELHALRGKRKDNVKLGLAMLSNMVEEASRKEMDR